MKRLMMFAALSAFLFAANAQTPPVSASAPVSVAEDKPAAKECKDDKHKHKKKGCCSDEKKSDKECKSEKKACCKDGHHGDAEKAEKKEAK